jgi:hypothetical protein
MESDPSKKLDSPQIDFVYSLFMKLFFYLGILGFIPYFFLHLSPYELTNLSFNSVRFLIIFGSAALFILFTLDLIGMNSMFLDRISRLITLIFTIVGFVASIVLFSLTREGWEQKINSIILWGVILLSTFCFLGWFYVRSERGLSPHKTKPFLNETIWVFLYCGCLFLIDFYFNGAFLIGLAISFLAFPVVLFKWGKPKVVPHIKSRSLVIPYKRATFYNYIIDATKALFLIMLILAISYDGTVVLYPQDPNLNHLWIRNLAFVGIFGALSMALYTRVQNVFYGLVVIILLYLLCILQYILVNTIYFHSWIIISLLNGFILAGVFYYLEQKIHKSPNVSVMPGSFYLIIILILIGALLLRETPEIDDVLENMKFTLSLIGLAYLFGYVREAPKQKSLRVSI